MSERKCRYAYCKEPAAFLASMCEKHQVIHRKANKKLKGKERIRQVIAGHNFTASKRQQIFPGGAR